MIKKGLLVFLAILGICTCHAQESPKTLSAEEVMLLVKKFHPVVKQTYINIEKSKAGIIVARAGFDPVYQQYISKKTFDGINYYNHNSAEIVIPTWYGIEVYSGLENLTGNRIDPSASVGKTSFIGLSVPLAKDIVIDKRRAALQQAKIFNSMTIAMQQSVINDVLFEAMDAYWHWVKTYETYKILKNNVIVNEKRVELVKKSYVNGERPAIDTVEAIAQLQSFQYLQNAYKLAFENARQSLSAYCWHNNNEPYELPNTITPETNWEKSSMLLMNNIVLDDLLTLAYNNHPELLVYSYKLDALAVDKKLKFQELLPKINFRYNQLGKGYDILKTSTTGTLFDNNFQYGLKIEVPLRLSNGRGEYKRAALKIEETKLDQLQKRRSIEVKIKNYYNEFVTLQNQITLQNSNYNNYQKLVVAEQTRFFNGESSLFLINSRENKALEALEKLIELKTKYIKTYYALQWSAGLIR